MRTIGILFLALIAGFASCKKEDDAPKFTSAEGDWTYTTPDGKISVMFTIANGISGWSVTNAVIRVDGTAANNTHVEATGVNPPSIGYIRINSNDSKLTYPFPIDFENGTVSSDFTQINVPDASYTWPHDKTNVLTNITITRQ